MENFCRLAKVDGLTPSGYLIETTTLNIEGDITKEEVKKRIYQYFKYIITTLLGKGFGDRVK